MKTPIEVFTENWREAKAVHDANANYCTLATLSADGLVSMRTLVFRGVIEGDFVIFVNETSPKWQDMLHSTQLELLLFWPSMMQQYRIRGVWREVSAKTMKLNWENKPYEAKLLDHYYGERYPQSSVVESREVMLREIEEIKARFPRDKPIPFPGNAKGIAIRPNQVEIWRGSDADRIHHRARYVSSGDEWIRETLVP